MPVSDKRLAEIRELSNGERVDHFDCTGLSEADWERLYAEWDEEALAFCRENTDPEELHAFADTFNWDGGVDALKLIVRNPACEAATALLIYWKAAPEFFLQYANRDAVIADSPNIEDFDFVTEIEARYVRGEFQLGLLSFDPNNPDDCGGAPFVGTYDDLKDQFVRELPPVMYQAVLGTSQL